MIVSVQLGLREALQWHSSPPLDSPTAARQASASGLGGRGYLICPGYHPGISSAVIDRCVATFTADPRSLVIAFHADRAGHPLILPADLAAEVLAWPPGRGLNQLRHDRAERVREVETDDPGIFVDIDTVSDLEAWRREK